MTDLPRASWIGTAVFTITAVIAAATAADVAEIIGVVVDLLLFVGGVAAYVVAYATAVRRSRTDDISVGTLFLLLGPVAPRPVKRTLFGAVAVQAVVALSTAGARPYSPPAFGILVPVWGLGLAGLWAARHGHFPPRRAAKTGARPT